MGTRYCRTMFIGHAEHLAFRNLPQMFSRRHREDGKQVLRFQSEEGHSVRRLRYIGVTSSAICFSPNEPLRFLG